MISKARRLFLAAAAALVVAAPAFAQSEKECADLAKSGEVSDKSLNCLRQVIGRASGPKVSQEDMFRVIDAAMPFIRDQAARNYIESQGVAALAKAHPKDYANRYDPPGVATLPAPNALPAPASIKDLPVPVSEVANATYSPKVPSPFLTRQVWDDMRAGSNPSLMPAQSYIVGQKFGDYFQTLKAQSNNKDLNRYLAEAKLPNGKAWHTRYSDGSEFWIEIENGQLRARYSRLQRSPSDFPNNREYVVEKLAPKLGGFLIGGDLAARQLGLSAGDIRPVSSGPVFGVITQTPPKVEEARRMNTNAAMADVAKWVIDAAPKFAQAARYAYNPRFIALLGRSAPVLGQGIGLWEGVTGNSFFTGEPLSPAERLLAFASLVPGEGALVAALGSNKAVGEVVANAVRTIEATRRPLDIAASNVAESAYQVTDKTVFAGVPVLSTARQILDSAAAVVPGIKK